MRYSCSQCGYETYSKDYMTRHMKRCTNPVSITSNELIEQFDAHVDRLYNRFATAYNEFLTDKKRNRYHGLIHILEEMKKYTENNPVSEKEARLNKIEELMDLVEETYLTQ